MFRQEDIERAPVQLSEYGYILGGYSELIETFAEIVLEVSSGSYQGDTRYLIKDKAGRFGLALVGWGSCSGCDALEACRNEEDYESHRNELIRGAEWFETPAECAEALASKDWKGVSVWGHEEEDNDFVLKAWAALGVDSVPTKVAA